MREVVVVDGLRTPFVRAGTVLKEVSAGELGRAAARELIARVGIDPAEIDDVVFGCVAQPSDAANIARVIALRAGVPEEKPAVTVGRNCGSGLEAITQGCERIRSGRADCVLVGGVESMSRIPLQYPLRFGWKVAALSRARTIPEKLAAAKALRLRDFKPEIALEQGLTDPTCGEIMGLTAERLAREWNIDRGRQDEYALRSHQRAVAAADFRRGEIHPVGVPPRFYDLFADDVGPRENQSTEKLAKMRPYFDRRNGSVTIGNSCGITDGGVALLLMERSRAERKGLPILGVLRGHAFRGCEPKRMGLGPVYATPGALEDAGVTLDQIQRVELNEAFAAQVLACLRAFADPEFGRELGLAREVGALDPEIVNVNGGAIALGHPVGATGARLVLTLLRELKRSGGGLGLASLCIGGGQGGAMVVEVAA